MEKTENKLMKKSNIRSLTECAMLIAVGTVLMQVKVFEMPQGGSITLVSALPFVLMAFRHGTGWGLLGGLACALLQIVTGKLYAPPAGTALAFAGMIVLDYLLAFMVFGLADAFAKPFKNRLAGIMAGITAVMALRFLCHFVSGFLLWGSYAPEGQGAVIYSLTYNGTVMLPETILTLVVAVLLYKGTPELFAREQK